MFLFSFYLRRFPLSPQPTMGFQISLCKFHKNSLSEPLLAGKGVNLWDELTEHKAVFQKAFFHFLTEDIFFFTLSPLWAAKYHFSNCARIILAKGFWGESCNSVRGINRTQSSFSKSFLSVFILGYFLFNHSPVWASKYHFANSTTTVLAKVFLRGKL